MRFWNAADSAGDAGREYILHKDPLPQKDARKETLTRLASGEKADSGKLKPGASKPPLPPKHSIPQVGPPSPY